MAKKAERKRSGQAKIVWSFPDELWLQGPRGGQSHATIMAMVKNASERASASFGALPAFAEEVSVVEDQPDQVEFLANGCEWLVENPFAEPCEA